MAYLLVGLAILFWASSPAVGKILLSTLNPFQLLFYALLFCLLFMLAIFFIQGKLSDLKDISKEKSGKRLLLGITGTLLYEIFYYGSLSLLRAQETLIINYLWPIFVVIFARIVLGEKFSPFDGISFTLAFIGLFLSITQGRRGEFSPGSIWGVLLALGAAISYGIFSILSKKFHRDNAVDIFYSFLFAWCIVAVYLGITEGFSPLSAQEVTLLLFVGITNYALAYFCWIQAIKRGKTAIISLLIYLTPFVAIIYIRIFLKEIISLWSLLGLSLIVFGIILKIVGENRIRTNNLNARSSLRQ
ncbi:MAG: DMT family transporter [Candidatus Ratteibacteria bacterium]|jgi:drug/metabolite transporter (DMT)-like permease